MQCNFISSNVCTPSPARAPLLRHLNSCWNYEQRTCSIYVQIKTALHVSEKKIVKFFLKFFTCFSSSWSFYYFISSSLQQRWKLCYCFQPSKTTPTVANYVWREKYCLHVLDILTMKSDRCLTKVFRSHTCNRFYGHIIHNNVNFLAKSFFC